MKHTVTDGVAFFEDYVSSARLIQRIEINMDAVCCQTQLKSLESLKQVMAHRAIQLGGNCIICFEYGQKQVSFLQSFFSIDDIDWQGKGIVAVVDPDDFE